MTLSIIIPVYRVEQTLNRCIDSILSQMVGVGESWEILLIDDGSPDTCPALCDKWAQRDSHITAYHKTNGGLSDARNYGIKRAKGEWITFVDSDDEVEADTYPALLRLIAEEKQIDVVEFPVLVHANNADEHTLSLPDRTWTSARQYWHDTEGWEHCYAWNKLYRKELFDRVIFPKGRIFEDAWFWPEVLSHNPRIATTSKGLYRYIWNTQGITVNASTKHLRQLLVSQMRAACLMRTTPFSVNGRRLFRSMACRLYDIIRFSI